MYNGILEERSKENKRQRRKERRERSGLRHRKRFHLEGWQHPRCPLRGGEGGKERRARLSRHVGVRDAYKAAFMNRVFPGFDGSLAVELKTPLRVSRNFELHKFSSTCVYVYPSFFFCINDDIIRERMNMRIIIESISERRRGPRITNKKDSNFRGDDSLI